MSEPPSGSVLIVDDEPPARERLRQLLDDIGGWRIAGEATHGREALELCSRLEPDVVLLDIRMPGMDGIEVARHLTALENAPAVIFTTAYSDYAMQAFEAQAIGYVVKPVRRERLQRALQQAARLTRQGMDAAASAGGHRCRRAHICVRKARGLKLVPVEEILYFQADQKYVSVVHAGGEEISDETLKSLEEEFAGDFIRIHRHTLVALRHLQRMETDERGHSFAWLTGCGRGLPISRRMVGELRRQLRRVNT